MHEASTLYRLLGDEARLRLLRLLAIERLNVSELTGILGIAQSGVSRHLGLMKDAGLIDVSASGAVTNAMVRDAAPPLVSDSITWSPSTGPPASECRPLPCTMRTHRRPSRLHAARKTAVSATASSPVSP